MTTVYAVPDPDTTTRSDAAGRAPATTPPHADNDATAIATTTTALRFIRAIPSSSNRCRPFDAPRGRSVTYLPRFVRRGMHARQGTEVARISEEFVLGSQRPSVAPCSLSTALVLPTKSTFAASLRLNASSISSVGRPWISNG